MLSTDGVPQGVFIGPAGVLYNYMLATNFWVVPQKPTTTNAIAAG